MNPSDNPGEQLRHAPEDKLSGPRPRGLLLDLLAAGVEAGSLQPTLGGDSGPFRFGSIGHGIEVAEVCLLAFFALLSFGSWISGRRGHLVPGPLHEQASKSHGNFVVAKYAETTTIRRSLRTATGSRAKRREKAYVFGTSSCPGMGDDIEGGASAPSPPPLPPPLPPLSIDEVLQKSVWGFREKWWPPPYTAAAFEDARAEEAEGDSGGYGGYDMHPAAKAFLENHVYRRPSPSSISRTCPAVNETCSAVTVEEQICFLPSPSAANAAGTSFKSTAEETTGRTRAEPPDNIMSQSVITGFAPPSTRRTCPSVVKEICFLPSPSVINATSAASSSASAEETVGRARADVTNNEIVGSIIADVLASVVSSTPAVVIPKYFVETLSVVDEEEPERVLSRVKSDLLLSKEFPVEPATADMEPMSLSLPDGVTGGELRVSESGYEGDDDDDDDHDDDARSVALSTDGLLFDSNKQEEEEEEQDEEMENKETTSPADGTIGGGLRTIGTGHGDDASYARYVSTNRFSVLFESSEEEGDEVGENEECEAQSGSLHDDSLLLDSSEHEKQEQQEQEDYIEEDAMEKDERGEEGEDDEENEEWVGEEEKKSVENSLLLLPVPVVGSAEERTSMTTRLVKILRGLSDPHVAVHGEYLARNCSLSHSEDNRHLTWHKVLGEGAFGRVTLVSHELGKYAVKELTGEAGPDDQWASRNEMETILSVSDHPNIIRVVAMDPTLSTMPMMMEAGSMDMFDVVYNMTIPMRTKIRLLLGGGRGLGHMHAKGKVHRDVNAENIMVVGGEDDTTPLTAKVADFGMTCDIGTRSEARTGSPGYIPVENLGGAIEAGPDGDVFSFAVLMLFIFVKEELRENNMFAHSLLLTAEERVELDSINGNGGDSGEVFTFQCQVKDRVMYDGSFDETMLLPERLDDSVPSKSRVLEMLWCCLSTDRTFRPSMGEVVAMLEGLLEEED